MLTRPDPRNLEKKTDWMITWKDNPVRWVLFYYILGLIFSCLYAFVQEAVYPLPIPYLYKGLIVTVLIPCLTVAVSIARQGSRNGRRD